MIELQQSKILQKTGESRTRNAFWTIFVDACIMKAHKLDCSKCWILVVVLSFFWLLIIMTVVHYILIHSKQLLLETRTNNCL